jgi:acetoin utilization protein AcuB
MQVRDWMEKDFERIPVNSTIGEAKKILKAEDANCGVVCDGDKFVGILKSDKILGVDDSKPVTDFVDKVVYTLDPQDTLDEAAVFFLESDMEKLPVIEDEKIIGVLDLFQILDAFTQMAGFGEGGIRMELELEDAPGELKKVIDILYAHSLNILSILVHNSKEVGKKIVILRVIGKNVKDLAEILEVSGISYRSIIKEEEV